MALLAQWAKFLTENAPGSDLFFLIVIRNDRLRYIARAVHSRAESSSSDITVSHAPCLTISRISYSLKPS